MSYLEMKSGGPSGSKAIISFWVKIGNARHKDDPWPLKPPDPIDSELSNTRAAYPGGSYYFSVPQFGAARIPTYPQNISIFQPNADGATWKDGMTPFLTWGDPDAEFDSCKWEVRALRSGWWIYLRGGADVTIISQVPVADKKVKNIVPQSMIGSHNGQLRIILQTSSKPKLTGYAWAQTRGQKVTVKQAALNVWTTIPPGPHIGAPGTCGGYIVDAFPFLQGSSFSYSDVSTLECGGHPETFVMDTGVSLGGGWHHILLSYDLSGEGGGSSRASGGDGLITAEATGPDGEPCFPGPYGDYSGPMGEFALGGPNNNGKPYEECGKWGYADGGKISSKCKAWLVVDGHNITGKNLHHAGAWARAQGGLSGLGPNDIVPPNALLALGAEIRMNMTTSLTAWEREYRPLLPGFTGPKTVIEGTGEKRRFDYERPKYELSSASLTSGPFSIPAGTRMIDRNDNVMLAELQIWTGKSIVCEDHIDLFMRGGQPVDPKEAAEGLGAEFGLGTDSVTTSEKDDEGNTITKTETTQKPATPSIILHWSSNWVKGLNHGTASSRESGRGVDKTSVEKKGSGFEVIGNVERYTPDPSLGGGSGFAGGVDVVLPAGDPIGSGGSPGAGPGLPSVS